MSLSLTAPIDLIRPAGLPTLPKAGAGAGAAQAGAGAVADPKTRARIDATAKSFESQFLSVMLGQMFEGTEISAPFGGGEGEAAFKSFLTDAMAKSITRQGGIGLAKDVSREMLKMQGLS